MEDRRLVVSLLLNSLGYGEALTRIIELSVRRQPSYICFANVHMTVEAHWSKDFAKVVNSASLVLADGVPIAKAIRWLYGDHQERIAGMDAMPDLMKLAEENNLKVFFFGSTEEYLKGVKNRSKMDYPSLRIVGMLSPPFGMPLNNENYINQINDSGANMIFVALGCPKQEKWMAENSHRINAPLLGVGGALSVYAGFSKRAPYWMQKFSLEWFYRLIQEPGRMWKRYMVTNTLFMYLFFKQFISSLFSKLVLK